MTDAGTTSTAALLEASVISVFVSCAALMRTMKLLVAPTVMVSVAGSMAVICGGGGTTLTSEDALAPFKLAAIPA
jgi:hypothetical protein